MKCRHCGSKYVSVEDMEWNGERPDGSNAPQQWLWLCLECDKYTTTIEYND